MDPEERSRFVKAVNAATRKGRDEVDPERLRTLKELCRTSDSHVEQTFKLLWEKLGAKHAQVRLLAVQVTGELFARSRVFRTLLLEKIHKFFERTVGTNPDHPLPPPHEVATLLRNKALDLVEEWHSKFGHLYKQLNLGRRFLRDTLHIKFPNPQETRQADREETTQRLLAARVEQIQAQWDDFIASARLVLEEMEAAFRVILPKPEEFTDWKPDHHGEEGFDDHSDQPVQAYGLGSRSYELTIELGKHTLQEPFLNNPVCETLRGAWLELDHHHVPLLLEWIHVLTRYKPPETEKALVDRYTKEAIDWRRRLLDAMEKYREVGLDVEPRTRNPGPPESEDDDDGDDEFEDAPRDEKEGFELAPPELTAPDADAIQEEPKDRDPAAPIPLERLLDQCDGDEDNGERVSAHPESGGLTREQREELLRLAPDLPFQDFMIHWGQETIPLNTSGLERHHRFFGVAESEGASIPLDRLDFLSKRATFYESKFEPVSHACRAPLPNGRLCTRHDRVRCPFHGIIVPRDDQGRPLDKGKEEEGREKEKERTEERPRPHPRDIARAEIREARDYHKRLLAESAVLVPWPGEKDPQAGEHTRSTRSDPREEETPCDRLRTRLLDPKRLRRVGDELDRRENLRQRDKFPNRW